MRNPELLRALRPQLPIFTPQESSEIEHFQNDVLRPILKFQHELIIDFALANPLLLDKAKKQHKKDDFLAEVLQHLQKNQSLKSVFIGIVVGLLTQDEFLIYVQHEKECHKRITNMIAQRITDTLFGK